VLQTDRAPRRGQLGLRVRNVGLRCDELRVGRVAKDGN